MSAGRDLHLLPAPVSYWFSGLSQHESYELARAQQKDDNGVWFKRSYS